MTLRRFHCWCETEEDEHDALALDAMDARAAAEAYVEHLDDGGLPDSLPISVRDDCERLLRFVVQVETKTTYTARVRVNATDEALDATVLEALANSSGMLFGDLVSDVLLMLADTDKPAVSESDIALSLARLLNQRAAVSRNDYYYVMGAPE